MYELVDNVGVCLSTETKISLVLLHRENEKEVMFSQIGQALRKYIIRPMTTLNLKTGGFLFSISIEHTCILSVLCNIPDGSLFIDHLPGGR